MSAGLEAMCGSSFNIAVRHFTGNRFVGFLCGVLFTGLTQSSSLATVIVVGITDAGIMPLGSAIAVIIGANVGTTVTGQLLSFQLFDYALPIVVTGILLAILPRRGKSREGGRAILGLGILLSGLKTMGAALVPVTETQLVASLLQSATIHPWIGILAGAGVTAVVQSSSAVVGIAITLAREGVLTLAAGVGIIIGADVGTCVTSMIAGLGTGLTARRAAFAHLLFNICSVLLIIPIFPTFVRFAYASADTLPRQLANAHTLYNISGAVVLLLLLNPFQWLVERLIQTENPKKKRITSLFGELFARWL